MTFTPAAANAYAVTQPVRPPPTTTTSVFVAPRYRGCAGTRDFGNRSIHGDWPYLVGIGRTLYRAGWAGRARWAGPADGRSAWMGGIAAHCPTDAPVSRCAISGASLPALPAHPGAPTRGAPSCDRRPIGIRRFLRPPARPDDRGLPERQDSSRTRARPRGRRAAVQWLPRCRRRSASRRRESPRAPATPATETLSRARRSAGPAA